MAKIVDFKAFGQDCKDRDLDWRWESGNRSKSFSEFLEIVATSLLPSGSRGVGFSLSQTDRSSILTKTQKNT